MFSNLIKKLFFIGIIGCAIGLILMTSSAFAQELTVSQSVYGDTVVNFRDSVIEEVVRQKIQKYSGDILYKDIKYLEKIEVLKGEVSTLDGIEFCTNLKELRIFNNEISDITPLRNLANLQYLHILNSQII